VFYGNRAAALQRVPPFFSNLKPETPDPKLYTVKPMHMTLKA